jgi:DNA-binding transcriptional LysR family regulator
VALSSHVPELSALEVLLAVGRTGSLGAAGRELGLSQQATSWRMRATERLVGVRLLHRGARGSSLTEAGALLADWAARVVGAAEELDAAIAALRTNRDRLLNLAASHTVAEYLLPGWLVQLRGEPGAQAGVNLMVHNSEQVSELVLAGQADLGFVEGPAPPTGLSSLTVATDELVLVVPPGHRWARRRRPVEPSELAATALVVREQGSGTRTVLDQALSAAAPQTPRAAPVLEMAATTAIRHAVLAGAGPAVLSNLAVRDDLATGQLVKVRTQGLNLHRRLRGIWPDGPAPAGPGRALLRIAAHALPGNASKPPPVSQLEDSSRD